MRSFEICVHIWKVKKWTGGMGPSWILYHWALLLEQSKNLSAERQ